MRSVVPRFARGPTFAGAHGDMGDAGSPPRTIDEATMRSLRLQAAVLRSLLDEVEAGSAGPEATAELVAQLADELERLGQVAREAARAVARRSDPAGEP